MPDVTTTPNTTSEEMRDISTSNLKSEAMMTEYKSPLLPPNTYPCNTCRITFRHGHEQRAHMQQPWHVHNIRRRAASQPPTALEDFQPHDEVGRKAAGPPDSNTNDTTDDLSDRHDSCQEQATPFQCLFCSEAFQSDDSGLVANVEHMRTVHAFTIPQPEKVAAMQSFIGYLATEVREWHECLSCGATKPSTPSIQNHMRDRGHCGLNLDREPELLGFWEDASFPFPRHAGPLGPQGHAMHLSATELRLASGKVVGSKHGAATTKKASRKRSPAAKALNPPGTEGDQPANSSLPVSESPSTPRRRPGRHEEMGVVGISGQARQALVVAEKRAQRSETAARRAREWVSSKAANSQEFDQLDNKRRFGKQNHKLLPR